jgi:2-dehydro-3-deoxy-L-rhamnonate dehydrogenase (NAD+)
VDKYDLQGRTAMVTGGASGIGHAACAQLVRAGARVASLDLQAATWVDLAVIGDVTSAVDVTRAVAEAEDVLATIDVLVCAAGIFGPETPTAGLSDAVWQRVLDVNATGTLRLMRAVLPSMVDRGYGRIVNVASIAAREGVIDGDAYAASKAAVVSLTRTVGRSVATTGVLVNCVIPALIDTAMVSSLSAAQREFAESRIPMGRLGRADEVARLITFLCSEDLSFSTGASFDTSGGRANY